MLGFLFVSGFFLMFLLTGISMLGLTLAFVAASALTILGGLILVVVKMQPQLGHHNQA